ncbi:uncharacterized protein BJ212DRAFT_1339831 [Suillus subaureus]|uniref:Uncharacterized protein n=1 Tax=Suillus subaureus TaxID=48587 RepID=A0A9P7EG61_9AGAM|nr:uncharacterized protein BJ212DRAFT_1416993 [Suillus subaureus]XP_041195661.1 uncharacterized protein BJ212DRAFT_1339831 [Suillus subaureus]KAG1792545.1 hypothetical protein BJ212DRAFT_1416993 [Suillus subaureus]KAG1820390.1 hypothetical protein BJ212DRAFT_1339831 [Suillus subaureus]
MVATSFFQLIRSIRAEIDPSFLSLLYRALANCICVVGIAAHLRAALIEATKH